jgi:hypothetical protein
MLGRFDIDTLTTMIRERITPPDRPLLSSFLRRWPTLDLF